SPKTSNYNYGFFFTGYINFPVAGSYTFQLISGDGGKLYVDASYSYTGVATVDDDGVHGNKIVTGSAKNYSRGAHPFTMTFFKSSTGTAGSLTLLWMTPQTNGQFVIIPSSAFVQNAAISGTPPVAPSNLVATAATAKKINLTWQDNSNNETGFQVFRSTSAGGTYLAVATVKPGTTSYGDSTLNASTTYYYKVCAIDQAGSSAYTSIASSTTLVLPGLPAAPGSLSGVVKGPTAISLSWKNNANNATAFEVWRSAGSNTNYELAAKTPVATSNMDTGLTKSTVYYYKVRAVNEGGSSNFSNEISLTTSSSALTTVTITSIQNQTMVNDTTVVVGVSASSSSAGAAITYSSAGLPAFAVLVDNHNGTATLTMKPNSVNLGTWKGVQVIATDAFGGSSRDVFNITVNGRNADIVQVSFNTSSNPVTALGWNGMNIGGATSGASAGNFKDVKGVTTTEGVTLTSNFDGAYATGMNTGNNSGIYPDNVLKNFYFGSNSGNYSFKVTGLSAGKKYSLVLYAGYPWTATDQATYGKLITNFTVGGQAQTLDVANNTSNAVQFSGLVPDATGAIEVTLNKQTGSAYCLINDMQIIAYDASTTATLIPPSNLGAIGQNFAVRLNWVNSSDTRTGLEIWRAKNPYGTFSLLNTVGASVTTYLDATVPANSTYFYKIREVVSGGKYSDFSNIAGGSIVQYTVNVSLNSQPAGSQPAPWNDINTLLSNGFGLNNLTDMNARRTGINLKVVNSFTSFNDQLGVTTGNNSGVVPDAVMKTFYYNSQGDTARIAITGLSRTQIYNFGFYAGTSYNNAPTVGIYQIGDRTVSLNAYNNTKNMVFVDNVKPDSTGTVNISFYTDISTAYAMWTSLTMQGMPSPDVIAADSAGIAGSIANNGGDPSGPVDSTPILRPDTATQTIAGKLVAYPNPFVDNIVVSLGLSKAADKFTLILVDVAGRIMQKREFSGVPTGTWQQTLNLSRLTKGVYLIRVLGLPDGMARSFRIVKVNR
ncbi:MAG: T9SS type A sorting domain-containing protein, partial [Bacteroidetes bacterium]|nr:T9SS type A sorting domain-containing protein [Bacteroidota bacterium]